MMDVECPYCGEVQDINHDDGYGFTEDEIFEQECVECEKIFAFTTSILFQHEAHKADCLNGGKHKYKRTHTYPIRYTKMRCVDCDHERKLTDAEFVKLELDREH